MLLAEALEAVVGALAGGGAVVAAEAQQALDDANREALLRAPDAWSAGGRWQLYGWDVERGTPEMVLSLHRLPGCEGGDESSSSDDSNCCDSESDGDGADGGTSGAMRQAARAPHVEGARLVELESSKLEAMRAAVELACALVAVDDVLVDAR